MNYLLANTNQSKSLSRFQIDWVVNLMHLNEGKLQMRTVNVRGIKVIKAI
jgi:hypothetical protein